MLAGRRPGNKESLLLTIFTRKQRRRHTLVLTALYLLVKIKVLLSLEMWLLFIVVQNW